MGQKQLLQRPEWQAARGQQVLRERSCFNSCRTHLHDLAHDLLEDLAVRLVVDAVLQREIYAVVFPHPRARVPDGARAGEEVAEPDEAEKEQTLGRGTGRGM